MPTHGILEALIKQKDALIEEIEAVKAYDKSKSDQLDHLLRSIERAVGAANSMQAREDEMTRATRNQMDDVLKAMHERVDQLATHRFKTLLDDAASSLCSQCADVIRNYEAQAGATAEA